jgi:hypothetical protein
MRFDNNTDLPEPVGAMIDIMKLLRLLKSLSGYGTDDNGASLDCVSGSTVAAECNFFTFIDMKAKRTKKTYSKANPEKQRPKREELKDAGTPFMKHIINFMQSSAPKVSAPGK